MKAVFLFICVVAIFTAGVTSGAGAVQASCAHHITAAADDGVDTTAVPAHNHSKTNGICKDCCCHHNHVMAKHWLEVSYALATGKTFLFELPQAKHSQYSPSLYKPPIA
ncbi:MAG: hypothetical protein LRZ85_00730 [Alphaproteobacteria bacterium]|nr:hypothetical protein [Alphaproteobacteria bacterium]MCD8525968.1 hypothetical protein [Alphaproteobacteria bacterium]MCD8570906.1 hypothetical protein [Alphaproteobacteria bacterium]